MRSTRTAAAAAALLTLTLLAGCGGGDDDKKSSDKETVVVTETPTETPTTEATTDTSASPMDPTGDVSQEQLDAALLTPEEVGDGFVLGDYSDSDDPPVCDPSGSPVDEQVPPQVQGGTAFDHSTVQASVQEEISIYASDAEAANAFALGSAGITCSEGTLPDGTAITIDAPQDVTSDVDPSGLGSSTAWGVSGDGFEGVLIVTLAHRVIQSATFIAATDADTSTLPNPLDIAAAAWAKALAN